MIYSNKYLSFILCAVLFLITSDYVNAQKIVDKTKGNHNYIKKGYMDGNLVNTVYYNMGEVSDWQNDPLYSGVWPKGSGHTYVDGVAVIVQAEATAPNNRIIHPLETNYYEYTRYDVGTGVTYGWWPLPGYFNPYFSTPAQSSEPNSWPVSWPDRNSDWSGKWNGFFGLGVLNADLESYFVMDDNEDREYILRDRFHPDADDTTRGGLGMQVHTRGFQWSQVLAEDVIFWLYEVTNMGTYDYRRALFAQYVDWGIGGHDNSSNNAGDYNEDLDMSYAWSTTTVGSPGNWSPVGVAGYAFLESPGISDDYKDNDGDGLTDERRDNKASVFINTVNEDSYIKDVAQDTVKFRKFYGYPWRAHWDADENANWNGYIDVNGNGKYDVGEPLRDDVGSDGIGPYDDNYTGPDFDGSEGNGKPDQGEPNFGLLDKDESDQLGLTGFLIFPTHTPYDLNNDERNWAGLSALPAPHGQSLVGVNLANYFSSYFIHLFGRNTYGTMTGQTQLTGETERFSMSLIFAIGTSDLFRRKKTVQQIYNANYHFAKPPEKPTVKAVEGDQRITLYWDNKAENSFDAFYQRINFEGYRVYRSTEPNFLEDKIITDANGQPIFRKPIAQFDLVDGVTGLHPIDVAGAKFYLGDDSGLKHSFTDTTVQNGQTYYYAVVSYDKGFTDTSVAGVFQGIPPSETTSIIKLVNGKYKTDINTVVVTPHAPSAGYIAPDLLNKMHIGSGTGTIEVSMIDPDSLRKSHSYKIEFADTSLYHNNTHPTYTLVDLTSNDTLIKKTSMKGLEEQTNVIHGFTVKMTNDTIVSVDRNVKKTAWAIVDSTFVVTTGFDKTNSAALSPRRVDYPADFEITFTEPGKGDTLFPSSTFPPPPFATNIKIKNLTENIDHWQFVLFDQNKDSLFNAGDAIFLVVGDSAGRPATDFGSAHFSWSMSLFKDTTRKFDQKITPNPGEVYRIVTKKPFRAGETFTFTSKAPGFDQNQAKNDLNRISVVPNPYVGAASWEQQSDAVGRGERKIYFTHLPAKCTIRIYTISGKLVQQFNHDSSISDGQESWNLVSRDGMDIAYGVYIYHVDAPGIGTKINRFAIIK